MSESWGIVRYPVSLDRERGAFDGWYADREEAAGVYHWWCERYPDWVVALVSADDIRFVQKIRER